MDIFGADGPNKGKTILAIYELNGDTLRVCYDLTGKVRPTEFKTKKGELLFLAIYRHLFEVWPQNGEVVNCETRFRLGGRNIFKLLLPSW